MSTLRSIQGLKAGVLLVIVLTGLTGLAGTAAEPQPVRKKLLFLTHAGLYKHTSLGSAEKAVIELGKAGGFDVTTVEGYKQEAEKLDFSFFTPEYLAGFDGLMMMTNGNPPMTDAKNLKSRRH